MPTKIMGFTCLEQNCLYPDFEEEVDPVEVIVFGNVDGYSIVIKPPFIQPNFPVYCLNYSGEIIEIKRAEIFDDIFQTFTM